METPGTSKAPARGASPPPSAKKVVSSEGKKLYPVWCRQNNGRRINRGMIFDVDGKMKTFRIITSEGKLVEA